MLVTIKNTKTKSRWCEKKTLTNKIKDKIIKIIPYALNLAYSTYIFFNQL